MTAVDLFTLHPCKQCLPHGQLVTQLAVVLGHPQLALFMALDVGLSGVVVVGDTHLLPLFFSPPGSLDIEYASNICRMKA